MSRARDCLPGPSGVGRDHLVGLVAAGGGAGRGGSAGGTEVRALAGALASVDGHRPGACTADLVSPLLVKLAPAAAAAPRVATGGAATRKRPLSPSERAVPAAKRSATAGLRPSLPRGAAPTDAKAAAVVPVPAAARAVAAASAAATAARAPAIGRANTVVDGDEDDDEDEEGEVEEGGAADAWSLWPLGSVTSVLRELTALYRASLLPPELLDALLHGAADSAAPSADSGATVAASSGAALRGLAGQLPAGFLAARLAGLNASQSAAAMASLGPPGLTLVQGPPGTGKTTTVLAVLNCAHLAGLQRWREVQRRGEAAVLADEAGLSAEVLAGLDAAASAADEADARARAARRAAAPEGARGGSGGSSLLGSLLTQVGDGAPSGDHAETPQAGSLSAKEEAALAKSVKRALSVVSLRERLLERAIAAAAQRGHKGAVTAAASLRGGSSRHRGLASWLLRPEQDEMHLLRAARGEVRDRPRILVCTHSNAAVDNILQRIVARGPADGPPFLASHTPPGGGPPALAPYNPAVLRVGSADKAAPAVRASGVLLSDRADAVLRPPARQLEEEAASLRGRCDAIRASLRGTRRAFKQDVSRALAALGADPPASAVAAAVDDRVLAWAERALITVEDWQRAAAALERAEWARRAGTGGSGIHASAAREAVQWSLMDDADVVFATLSSAAVSSVEAYARETGRGFETVVVDEAAQAPEASTLIPLRYGCRRCVLVGDPQQLPATVISPVAARLGLDRSLFARLAAAGSGVLLLNVQHRMHPAIAAFPSARFYGGRVMDAREVRGSAREQAFHALAHFRPFVFFDCAAGGGERRGAAGGASRSYSNEAEARLAACLVASLMRWRGAKRVFVPAPGSAPGSGQGDWRWETRVFTGSVGILTPYQGQIGALRAALLRQYAEVNAAGEPGPSLPTIEPIVSTVDSAQGREFDVVILSAVRSAGGEAAASAGGGEDDTPDGALLRRRRTIGFVKDQRRLNVALTRGRFAVWVIGDAATLAGGSQDWSALVEHATANRVLYPVRDVGETTAAILAATAASRAE
ncbi:hypothetical protein FNF29_02793 [Cafeteria roenbergensis]|uniref:AAA+ ATPase domain-containing protein n=1 Tax=Cafeteria roenbergensis TaxID=33653 RepID=A0A5A8CMW0_CAFRO|nr:hypothetical protein FNF29_02793 [Cafeteria roenbergensis]|eukprot:KAA0153804.1 hypothetical protein FNF29_02793 [Cafeteria roenbergensis]